MIIAAFDGSENGRRALDRAIEQARATDSELGVVTVAPGESHMLAFEDILIPDTFRERYRDIAREGAQYARKMGVDAEPLVREGDVADEILKACEEHECTLIVIGRRGHGRVTRFLLGSVAEKIVKHAKTSVLIVR